MVQRLGASKLFYGGCEGRSFWFPVLMTTTHLMWILVFFYAPGQDTPRIRWFFNAFYFQGTSAVSNPYLDGARALGSFGTKFLPTFMVFIMIIVVSPLLYGLLLPNYTFPYKWASAA